MKISPKYTSEDWKNLRLRADSDEGKWQKAIDILEDRIRGRFFKPICLMEGYEFAGFAVMALDCLLIETLQQFRHGDEESPKGYYRKGAPKGRSRAKIYYATFFVDFCFNGFDKTKADMFYEQIRCGILHQAETKKSSLVRIVGPLVKVTEDGNGLIINRKLFHKELIRVFEDYIRKLREPNNKELRDNFKNKMNSICGTYSNLPPRTGHPRQLVI